MAMSIDCVLLAGSDGARCMNVIFSIYFKWLHYRREIWTSTSIFPQGFLAHMLETANTTPEKDSGF